MKESRFIELLNLYLDQQITSEEAAELEAEIARSPAHRRTYLQYCRMHRACKLLFESVHAPASSPLQQALQRADDKLLIFPPRYFNLSRMAWIGGVAAAAACLAAVVYFQRPTQKAGPALASAPTPMASTVPAAPVSVPTELFASAATTAARDAQFHPVFIVNRTAPAAAMTDAQRAALFDWMRQVQLSPLSGASGEFVLEAQPAPQPFDLNFRQTRRPVQGAVEMAGFEFQK